MAESRGWGSRPKSGAPRLKAVSFVCDATELGDCPKRGQVVVRYYPVHSSARASPYHFCSDKCQRNHWRERQRQAAVDALTPYPCARAGCDLLVEPRYGPGRPRLYHSTACQRQAERARSKRQPGRDVARAEKRLGEARSGLQAAEVEAARWRGSVERAERAMATQGALTLKGTRIRRGSAEWSRLRGEWRTTQEALDRSVQAWADRVQAAENGVSLAKERQAKRAATRQDQRQRKAEREQAKVDPAFAAYLDARDRAEALDRQRAGLVEAEAAHEQAAISARAEMERLEELADRRRSEARDQADAARRLLDAPAEEQIAGWVAQRREEIATETAVAEQALVEAETAVDVAQEHVREQVHETVPLTAAREGLAAVERQIGGASALDVMRLMGPTEGQRLLLQRKQLAEDVKSSANARLEANLQAGLDDRRRTARHLLAKAVSQRDKAARQLQDLAQEIDDVATHGAAEIEAQRLRAAEDLSAAQQVLHSPMSSTEETELAVAAHNLQDALARRTQIQGQRAALEGVPRQVPLDVQEDAAQDDVLAAQRRRAADPEYAAWLKSRPGEA